MKKLIPLILATALTLAACASAPDTASTPLANSTPEPTAATTPAPTTAPFYPVANSYNNGDTYYAFVHRGEDSLLLKTDYAAATQTVNCAVPGCAHDSDACPAYFTDDPGRNLVITDDPLRVCHVEDRGCPVQIYTVDPAAGKAMQEINGVGNCDIAYCDGTALYGIDKTVLPSEATPACRIDLASGQLDRFTMLPSELMLGCYDDGLLTVHYVTDAPLPKNGEEYAAAVQSATLEFDCWDPRTGTRTKLAERLYNPTDARFSGYDGTANDKLYFVDYLPQNDGTDIKLSLTVVDPAMGTEEKMWDTWPDEHFGLSMGQRILPVHGDQSTRWLGMCYSNSGTNHEIPYFMDLETGEIKEVTQKREGLSYDRRVTVLAQTNDGRWLIETTADEQRSCLGMALITPEQLLAGSTDWQEITMWQG